MNANHARLCPSPAWAEHMHTEVLPRLTQGCDLGDAMIEVGPGPGAATDFLRRRVLRLTAVELDEVAAAALAQRFAATNVDVVHGDATMLELDDDTFDSAGSFTMLHHVPTVVQQDKLLAEILRVLRPGGLLLASDSLPSETLKRFHAGDVYNPIDPSGLLGRLEQLGYHRACLSTEHDTLTFCAYKAEGS